MLTHLSQTDRPNLTNYPYQKYVSMTRKCQDHRLQTQSRVYLDCFSTKKQISPPLRNQKITRLHLVMLQGE